MKLVINLQLLLGIKMSLYIYKNYRMGRNKKVFHQINLIALIYQVKIPTYPLNLAMNHIEIMKQGLLKIG